MNTKKTAALAAAAVLTGVMLGGCTYDIPAMPERDTRPSTLKPIGTNSSGSSYKGIAPTVEETTETFTSENKMCTIEKKKSYYSVTLDLSKGDGSYYEEGKAYGETLARAFPDYGRIAEPYLYENILNAFPEMSTGFSAIEDRMNEVLGNIDENYREELRGFAQALAGNSEGFKQDGILSVDEIHLFQVIPDVLRPFACSAVSLSGSKTSSGSRISCRLLEWDLGSSNQICALHAVVDRIDGERSTKSISFLGMLSTITAVNRNGVMVGILDVGSAEYEEFEYEGRTSYTYALRHALESFSTAKEVGDHLVESSPSFTYNCNIMITDADEAYCAELAVSPENGVPLLRGKDTPICERLAWDDPEVFCIVNSYTSEENGAEMFVLSENYTRWVKFNRLFGSEQGISTERFKELITSEKLSKELTNIRGNGLVHMAVTDYSDHTVQAVFTGMDGVDEIPEFISLGTFD